MAEKLSEKCMRVAMSHLPRGWTYTYRKSLTGRCSRKNKYIKSPKPVTRLALQIWLHECHHAENAYSQFPSYYAEYQCEKFSFDVMAEAGIEVHEKSVKRAKAYVKHRLEQGIRSGLAPEKVDPVIAEWCGYSTPEVEVNPKVADEGVRERLRKCLALAASDNPNEAGLAMEKAQEIMQQYNLRFCDIDERGRIEIEEREVAGSTKTRQTWESRLASSIARAFDGHLIFRFNGHGWRAVFVASKTDLEIACDLFERIRASILRMSRAYVDRVRQDSPWYAAKTLHNSYRIGAVRTVAARLDRVQHNLTPPAVVGPGTGKDLIVVKQDAVADYMQEHYKNIKAARQRRSSVDTGAYRQGMSDGNNIGLHRAVDSGAAPLGLPA